MCVAPRGTSAVQGTRSARRGGERSSRAEHPLHVVKLQTETATAVVAQAIHSILWLQHHSHRVSPYSGALRREWHGDALRRTVANVDVCLANLAAEQGIVQSAPRGGCC